MNEVYRAKCAQGHRFMVSWDEIFDASCPVCNGDPVFEDSDIQAQYDNVHGTYDPFVDVCVEEWNGGER